MKWPSARLILLTVTITAIAFGSATSVVSGVETPSYCVINNVHVSSITPRDSSSTIVSVTTTFLISCASGTPGTVWDVQTRLYAESSLLGVNSVSSSENQYTLGQGTIQYAVNSQFDAMSYYGYGEQTPSFYVKITATNTSTGSLDAQQEVPFAVDTSQYPFNVSQQNYCHFPGLSQYFQLLPGCGASSANSTVSTAPSSSNCNTYGLPEFLQPYLPGCQATENVTAPSSESSSPLLPTQQSNSPLASPSSSSTRTGTSRTPTPPSPKPRPRSSSSARNPPRWAHGPG